MSSESARQLLIGNGKAPLKLEYFAIEGVAEQVRITLTVAGIPFDDVGIPWGDWQNKKPTTKYGQMPELTLPNGTIITDSGAMLRLAGAADPEGKLYPMEIAARIKVEQILGLVGDLSRAWNPSLYLGMRPHIFGYPEKDEWSDADAVIKKVRTDFLANELPRYMGYFGDLIKEGGGNFLSGQDLTIADIAAYQNIAYFGKGIADFVPKESLEPFVEVTAWMSRVESHPKVSAYKTSKAK